MAKPTLLEIVQDILSDMDSDIINSIDDTEEAGQVAAIVKSSYDAMLSNRNWPHTKRIINLSAYSDNTLPTHMIVTDEIKEMISIYYDKRLNGETRLLYQEVKWLDPDDFLRYINGRNSDDSFIMTVTDPSGVKLLIQTNKAPMYYTSFDDKTIVFDSYDSTVDNTIQSSKTQARAYVMPELIIADDTVPDLPREAFSALIEESKSKAMFKLKQYSDSKAEQESVRQQKWLSRKAWTINGGIKFPDYGRNRGKSYIRKREPTFMDEN